MEYVAGVSQLMVVGATPSGVTSGAAIENLQDIDNTRLSLTGDHIRNSVKSLAKLWLKIYKQYATAPRVIQYTGKNCLGDVITWCNEDINSFDIEYDTKNELEISEEAQKQNFLQAYSMGAFADETGKIPRRIKQKLYECLNFGNFDDIADIPILQTKAAQLENTFFEKGIIPKLSDIDDDDIHIEEHTVYCLQMDFKILQMRKPEFAQQLLDHIKLHEQRKAQREQNNLMQMMQAQGGVSNG
jgi:SHS2 domain-containing protein